MEANITHEKQFAKELIDFIHSSPSPFHVVETIKKRLSENGFNELNPREKWQLQKDGKYFTTRNDTALIAFQIGKGEITEKGFNMIAAHTDAPALKIKPSPEMIVEGSYLKFNTETYGGAILSTWMDRPLSLAGRVNLLSKNSKYPETRFINFERPIAVIPNLAIHFNRSVNEGSEFNKQKHMLPVLAMINKNFEKDGFLLRLIADALNEKAENIIDFDLNLYEFDKGKLTGLNDEFISVGKLDDLAMVHSGLSAFLGSGECGSTKVLVCFDNEEVGSGLKQGAASPLLKNVLERIVNQISGEDDAFYRSIYSSFLVSADMAHALHPNYADMHDPVNRPIINKGPVIKINANQKYTTESNSDSVFEMICRKAEVPYQKYVNRSDLAGGSTLGSILTSQLDIRSVDVGNPMLAMHSIREMAGVLDHYYMKKAFMEFYGI